MFMNFLIGVYLVSVALVIFIEVYTINAGSRYVKSKLRKGYKIIEKPKNNLIAFLRNCLLTFTPFVNTVVALILLFCYEDLESRTYEKLDKYLTLEGSWTE